MICKYPFYVCIGITEVLDFCTNISDTATFTTAYFPQINKNLLFLTHFGNVDFDIFEVMLVRLST